MCCQDLRPFAIVEGHRFKAQEHLRIGAAYGSSEAEDLLPSARTVSRHIEGEYDRVKAIVLEELQQCKQYQNKRHNNRQDLQENIQPEPPKPDPPPRIVQFRAQILALMETLMVKTTSEIVSIFDHIYMDTESELMTTRRQVETLTQRLEERDRLLGRLYAENAHQRYPSDQVEGQQELLDNALFHGQPAQQKTEAVELSLDWSMVKVENQINIEPAEQPHEYQMMLSSSVTEEQQQEQQEQPTTGDQKPHQMHLRARRASTTHRAAEQHHSEDEEEEDDDEEDEEEEEEDSIEQDPDFSPPSPVSDQATPPPPQQRGRPPGHGWPSGRETFIPFSPPQHITSSAQVLQTQDGPRAKCRKIRVHLRDFPTWQMFKMQCLESSGAGNTNPSGARPSIRFDDLLNSTNEELLLRYHTAAAAAGEQPSLQPPQMNLQTAASACPAELTSRVSDSSEPPAIAVQEEAGASATVPEPPHQAASPVVARRRRGRPAGCKSSSSRRSLPLRSCAATSSSTKSSRPQDTSENSRAQYTSELDTSLSIVDTNAQDTSEELDTSFSIVDTRSLQRKQDASQELDNSVSIVDARSLQRKQDASVAEEEAPIDLLSSEGGIIESGSSDMKSKADERTDDWGEDEISTRSSELTSEVIPRKRRRVMEPECNHDVNGALHAVEQILKKRTVEDGQEEVRVKWLPCSSCGAKWKNSWEPA
ncbi:basic-leucine zipper transcription factor A-like [Engraulis encrasicolus]|uniref:basic-leucine zipper transcription factor A-like n=1 Tax=Engraulis encrasicolus TaxID=184585 RepID=UPI002FD13831